MAVAYRDPTDNLLQRIGAFVLDLVVFGAVLFAAQRYAFSAGERFPGEPSACKVAENTCVSSGSDTYLLEGTEAKVYLGLIIGALVVAFLNYVVLQGLAGATVGKFALGIRTLNSKDRPCGMVRAFVRTLFGPINFFCLGLVGIVAWTRSKNHRTVPDMIAGTTVVRKDFVAQRRRAEESAAAAKAAATEAGEAKRGAFVNTEPYPGAYGAPQGTLPAAPPATPPGFPAPGGATPPPGFTGPPATSPPPVPSPGSTPEG